MNAEVIKAMNKKEKKETLRKWWKANGYKILRVMLFPIWIGSIIAEKIQNKLNARNFWSEERADEILNYYVPRSAEWDDEEKEFYLFDNGWGWSIGLAKRYLKRKDRRFWELHNGFCGGRIRTFLIEDFELEGFTKIIGNCSDTFTEITFKLN